MTIFIRDIQPLELVHIIFATGFGAVPQMGDRYIVERYRNNRWGFWTQIALSVRENQPDQGFMTGYLSPLDLVIDPRNRVTYREERLRQQGATRVGYAYISKIYRLERTNLEGPTTLGEFAYGLDKSFAQWKKVPVII